MNTSESKIPGDAGQPTPELLSQVTTPRPAGLRNYIILKSGRNFLLSGLNLAVALALLPIITRATGPAGYGVFALLMTFSAQVNLVEFGFGAYITKKVSEWRQGTNPSEVQTFLSTSAWYMSILAIFSTSVVVVILFIFFDSFFKIPLEIAHELFWSKIFTVGIFITVFGTMFYSRILAGCHAFEFIRITNIASEVIRFGWIILVIGPQDRMLANLNWLLAVRLVVSIILTIALAIGTRRYLPTPFTFSWSSIDSSLRHSMMSFSGPLIIGKLLNRIQTLAGAAIVGSTLGPAGAGLVLLAQRIHTTMADFASNLVMTIFPMASRINAQHNSKLESLYLNGTYYNALLCTLIASSTAVIVTPLMRIFFTSEFSDVSLIVWVYLPVLVLGSLFSVGNEVILGIGKHKALLKHLVGMTLVSLTTQYIFTRLIGPPGIALGASTASLFYLASSWYEQRRILNAPIGRLLVQCLRLLAPVGVLLTCGFTLFPLQRTTSPLALVLWFSLTAICGGLVTLFTAILPAERKLIHAALDRLRSKKS